MVDDSCGRLAPLNDCGRGVCINYTCVCRPGWTQVADFDFWQTEIFSDVTQARARCNNPHHLVEALHALTIGIAVSTVLSIVWRYSVLSIWKHSMLRMKMTYVILLFISEALWFRTNPAPTFGSSVPYTMIQPVLVGLFIRVLHLFTLRLLHYMTVRSSYAEHVSHISRRRIELYKKVSNIATVLLTLGLLTLYIFIVLTKESHTLFILVNVASAVLIVTIVFIATIASSSYKMVHRDLESILQKHSSIVKSSPLNDRTFDVRVVRAYKRITKIKKQSRLLHLQFFLTCIVTFTPIGYYLIIFTLPLIQSMGLVFFLLGHRQRSQKQTRSKKRTFVTVDTAGTSGSSKMGPSELSDVSLARLERIRNLLKLSWLRDKNLKVLPFGVHLNSQPSTNSHTEDEIKITHRLDAPSEMSELNTLRAEQPLTSSVNVLETS